MIINQKVIYTLYITLYVYTLQTHTLYKHKGLYECYKGNKMVLLGRVLYSFIMEMLQ